MPLHTAMWVMGMLSLFPVLLGQRFRKIEVKGIRPWIAVLIKSREHSSPHIRTLAALLWNHLTWAFLTTRSDDGGLWILREDSRPWDLLVQVFGKPGSPKVWEILEDSSTRLELSPSFAYALTGLVFGLTVLNKSIKPETPPIISDVKVPGVDRQLANFDYIWDKLLVPELGAALSSPNERASKIAWQILTAVVSLPTSRLSEHRSDPLSPLINHTFLEGTFPKMKNPAAQAHLVARTNSYTCQPDMISPWSTKWLLSRTERILRLVAIGAGLDAFWVVKSDTQAVSPREQPSWSPNGREVSYIILLLSATERTDTKHSLSHQPGPYPCLLGIVVASDRRGRE